MAATLAARADERYSAAPVLCATCNKALTRRQREHSSAAQYCSSACAATATNKKRGPRTEASRTKTREALARYHASKPTSDSNKGKPPHVKHEKAEFSALVSCSCAHCGINFVARGRLKYCNAHGNMYKNNNRNRYAFTFSIKTHAAAFSPEELALLTTRGMWSYTNTEGVTRDHRVSVNEAIKNGYDPYYIKHPMNCQLMPWADNNKKKTKSSLTYIELIRLVRKYDATHMAADLSVSH